MIFRGARRWQNGSRGLLSAAAVLWLLGACSSKDAPPSMGGSMPPPDMGPISCVSGAGCDSGWCADPETGEIFGFEGARSSGTGLCCKDRSVSSNEANPANGCDNICGGKVGCFQAIKAAYLASRQLCGEPCDSDDDCMSNAYCAQLEAGGAACVPRDCSSCWSTDGECSYYVDDCTVESCDHARCGIPCEIPADCGSGSTCMENRAGELMCLPAVCQDCYPQSLCQYGAVSCEFGGCGACIPACDGKQCGSDGCDGSCGTCGTDQQCLDYECVPCPGAGEDCPAPFATCTRFAWTCDNSERMLSCEPAKPRSYVSGAECDLGDFLGKCTSQGACIGSGPIEPGSTAGTSSGVTSGGGALPPNCARNECLSVETQWGENYLCTTAAGKGYWGDYTNGCSQALFCALCAKDASGTMVQCSLEPVPGGGTFHEWSGDSNRHRCTDETQGFAWHCVEDADTECRNLLYERYSDRG